MSEITKTVLTDAKGRKLTLRKLNVLDQARLFRAMGADQANNQPYGYLVQTAASVADIDGTPVPFPTNERTIDLAIGMLGDPGYNAVIRELKAEMEAATAEAEDAAKEKPSSPLPPSAP